MCIFEFLSTKMLLKWNIRRNGLDLKMKMLTWLMLIMHLCMLFFYLFCILEISIKLRQLKESNVT